MNEVEIVMWSLSIELADWTKSNLDQPSILLLTGFLSKVFI